MVVIAGPVSTVTVRLAELEGYVTDVAVIVTVVGELTLAGAA